MKKVESYTISAASPGTVREVSIPEGAELLTAQLFLGSITIWARIDTGESSATHKFIVYETDQEIEWEGDLNHLGTVQPLLGGPLHIFRAFDP